MSNTIQKEKTVNPLLTNLQNPEPSVKNKETTNAQAQTKQTSTQGGNQNTSAAPQGVSGTATANEKPKDQFSEFLSGALAVGGLIALAWLFNKKDEKPIPSPEMETLRRTLGHVQRELAAIKREKRKVTRRVVEIEDVEPIDEKSYRNVPKKGKQAPDYDTPTAYLEI